MAQPISAAGTGPVDTIACSTIAGAGAPGGMRGKWLRGGLLAAGALLALGTSACQETDPLYREGLWRPQHVNRANLTLQVANPRDLVRGSGAAGADGQLAAAAVDRLRNDKVKKLPSNDLAQITASSSGDNNQTGGQ